MSQMHTSESGSATVGGFAQIGQHRREAMPDGASHVWAAASQASAPRPAVCWHRKTLRAERASGWQREAESTADSVHWDAAVAF